MNRATAVYQARRENTGERRLVEIYKEKIGKVAEVLDVQKTSTKLLFRLNTSTTLPRELWNVASSLSGELLIANESQVWVVCDRPFTLPLGWQGFLHLLLACFLVYVIEASREPVGHLILAAYSLEIYKIVSF